MNPKAEPAFDTFYSESWPNAVRVAAMLVQNSSAGEEIAQEAFVKIYPRWETLDRPEAYLRRMLCNAANSWHSRNKTKRAKLPLLVEAELLEPRLNELSDVIAHLPYRQRAVIVLRYYGNFSEAEIAESIGCRPGTVKSLAARALKVLSREVGR